MLKCMLMEQKVDILMIQEMKIKSDVFLEDSNSFWASIAFLTSNAEGASRGTTTLWNPTYFDGTVIHLARNCLIRMLDLRSRLEWFLKNIHAPIAITPRASL